jgi:hypothetical protein
VSSANRRCTITSIITPSTISSSSCGSPERSSHSITSRREPNQRVSTWSHSPVKTRRGRRLRSQAQRVRR